MPTPVTCPTCYRTFHVPDGFAGRGLCPDCRAGAPVSDRRRDWLDDEPRPGPDREPPRRPSPLDHLPAWRRVATGFLVQQAAAVLLLFGLALVVAAAAALGDDPGKLPDEPNAAQMVAFGLGMLALFLGLVVQLVGRFISAGTPVRAPRVPGFLAAGTGVLVLLGFGLLGFVMIAVAGEQQQGNVPDEATETLVGLLVIGWLGVAVAGEMCHALAVGSVGRVLRADGARRLGRGLVVCLPVGGVLGLFALCAVGLWVEANNPNGGPNPADDTLGLIFALGLSGAAGLYLVVDLVLLHQGRAAVARVAAAAEGAEFADRWG